MAKLECSLVNIYAMKSELDPILKRLQEMSVMDIETAAGDEETCVLPSGYQRDDTDDLQAEYMRSATLADGAIKILSERYPIKRKLTEMFSGPPCVEREKFYIGDDVYSESLEDINRVLELERSIAEIKAEKIRLATMMDQMKIWQQLDVPLDFSGTDKTSAFIGTLAGGHSLEELLCVVAEKIPEVSVHLEIISSERDNTYIFACCSKEHKENLADVLREFAFARPTQTSSATAQEKMAEYERKTTECDSKLAKSEKELERLAAKRRKIEIFADFCRGESEKYRVIGEIARTEHTVLIKGYIANIDLDELKKQLEGEFTVIIEVQKANEELAPVKLRNNAFATPAETITQMYSLPSHKDIDPSPLTGFFYYLLFGMMLSDAGYGLLMVIGTLFVIKKLNPSPSMKNTMKLFLYCGISTVFWGLLFGSFFGDSVAVISRTFFGKEISLPALIDPMNGGAVTLLILSLAIGLVQIIAGLVAKFVTCIKAGDKAGAFFDAGLWITTLIGIAIFAVGMFAFPILKTVGAALAVASLVGLVLTQGREKKNPVMRFFSGLASLYDITGYVSDLLSFSRLMALGLTTAAMGAVFNLLGTLGGKSIGGIILMLIIFPVGHAIGFALNALGAYVHTLRLQYVELFSKFYDGGGREFKAFSIKNKYVGIKNDSAAVVKADANYKEEK